MSKKKTKRNPNILVFNKINNWGYQYFEKKPTELSTYTFKNLEIESFIFQFFKSNDFRVQSIKLYHFDNILYIIIFYFLNVDQKEEDDIEELFCLNTFLEGISLFTKKNISLSVKQLNNSIKKEILKKEKKSITNIASPSRLRKYGHKKNRFFIDGNNILLVCLKTENSAKLLSRFIAVEFKRLRRHNFFLKFIKETLKYFFNAGFSNFKGIKIQIKGRFNKAQRTRHRIIKIGNEIPFLTIGSKVNYNESTAFTRKNGTFGIKVWIYEKKYEMH